MNNSKELKYKIINIFTEIVSFIKNSNKDENFIREILILFFNFIFHFKTLCNLVNESMNEYKEYKHNYGIQINNILNEL